MRFTHKMNTIMGQNKDAAIGFIGIGIIIAVIAGVVLVLLPEESETVQNVDVAKPNSIELDPTTVEQAEKVFPFFQDSFRLILEQCNAVNSYTDYLAFEESIPWTGNEIFIGIEDAKKALTLSEELGYDNHPTIGPMIKQARALEGAANDCITDLQDKYEIKLDTEEEVLEFIQNYRGKDNVGLTLDELLITLMNAAYPGEDILSSPSTTGYYIASQDYDKEISDRYWKVEIMIETYRETVYFEWVVDTETNLVYPGDDESKSVLDILDAFD